MKRTVSLSLLTLVAAVITWQLLPPPQELAAQKKISQLTEHTSPTSDDLVELTNDPGGTPASRKATLANLAKGINLSNAATGTLPVARGGTGVTTATGTGATVRGTSPDFTTGVTLGGVAIPTISSTSSLTNKTITSSTNTLGSVTIDATGTDATGDIYYRDAGGVLTRLGVGSTGQVVTVAGGLPSWATPSGGGLTKFTEAESTSSPNDTVYVDSLTAAGASTNVDFAIVPKGAGAIIAAIPDGVGEGGGGNKRGTRSVDLQLNRSTASQVASGSGSTVSGGVNNTSSGTNSVVCGGSGNIASGNTAVVSGGDVCTASGNYSSVLGGRNAIADKYGQDSFSAGVFAANGDSQRSCLVARRVTTNATPTELFLDGSSARCTIATDTTWAFTITVVARRTDADNESAAYKFEGCIDRNTGTSAALVGSVTKTVIAEDTAAWDCDVTADSTNSALIITVTGEAAKTIRWVARIDLTEVTG